MTASSTQIRRYFLALPRAKGKRVRGYGSLSTAGLSGGPNSHSSAAAHFFTIADRARSSSDLLPADLLPEGTDRRTAKGLVTAMVMERIAALLPPSQRGVYGTNPPAPEA